MSPVKVPVMTPSQSGNPLSCVYFTLVFAFSFTILKIFVGISAGIIVPEIPANLMTFAIDWNTDAKFGRGLAMESCIPHAYARAVAISIGRMVPVAPCSLIALAMFVNMVSSSDASLATTFAVFFFLLAISESFFH